MTKADLYLKDGVDVEEFVKAIWGQEYMISEEQTLSYKECKLTARQVIEFLKRQLKPTLTEDEKVILSNTNKDYEFIGRNDRSYLYMRVLSDNGNFGDRITGVELLFPNLFQFIKPRRRI